MAGFKIASTPGIASSFSSIGFSSPRDDSKIPATAVFAEAGKPPNLSVMPPNVSASLDSCGRAAVAVASSLTAPRVFVISPKESVIPLSMSAPPSTEERDSVALLRRSFIPVASIALLPISLAELAMSEGLGIGLVSEVHPKKIGERASAASVSDERRIKRVLVEVIQT